MLAYMCGQLSAFILNGKRDCYGGHVIYLTNCADETTLFIYNGLWYLIYVFLLLSLILPGILESRREPIKIPKIFE